MYCSECGAKADNGQKFCGVCGARLYYADAVEESSIPSVKPHQEEVRNEEKAGQDAAGSFDNGKCIETALKRYGRRSQRRDQLNLFFATVVLSGVLSTLPEGRIWDVCILILWVASELTLPHLYQKCLRSELLKCGRSEEQIAEFLDSDALNDPLRRWIH